MKAVREYRIRYPDKAVTYYADMNCPSSRDGWAVLMGGGSLPNVKLPDQLAKIIPTLTPADGIVTGKGQYCLANSDRNYIIYTNTIGGEIEVNVSNKAMRYRVHWIDSNSGEIQPGDESSRLARFGCVRSRMCCGWNVPTRSNAGLLQRQPHRHFRLAAVRPGIVRNESGFDFAFGAISERAI